MSSASAPPAVVLGLSPTGLHIVRTLGRVGIEVHGVAEGPQCGARSRYLISVVSCSSSSEVLEHLKRLAEGFLARGLSKIVIFPSSDQHVELLSRHADQISDCYVFQSSYRNGLATQIMDKGSFYKLCQDCDVRYPRVEVVDRARLAEFPRTMKFPWLIKPTEVHRIKREMRGEKGWAVRDEAEFESALRRIPARAGTLLVQEVVPGPESLITLACAWFDASGPRQGFTARKLRQHPPGFGSASLVQSHSEPESMAIMSRLLTAVGFEGVAASEFKRHPDTGELYIIEVNVRTSLWFSITDAAKRPVLLSAYRALAGLDPLPEEPQRDSLRWRYLMKDLASTLFYLRKAALAIPAPNTRATGRARGHVGAVFAWDDPTPGLADVWLLLRKAWSRKINGQGAK